MDRQRYRDERREVSERRVCASLFFQSSPSSSARALETSTLQIPAESGELLNQVPIKYNKSSCKSLHNQVPKSSEPGATALTLTLRLPYKVTSGKPLESYIVFSRNCEMSFGTHLPSQVKELKPQIPYMLTFYLLTQFHFSMATVSLLFEG